MKAAFRTRWIIWYAIVLHFVWAWSLLTDESAGMATAISGTLNLLGNHYAVAFSYLCASSMAMIALLRDRHDVTAMMMMLPQQGLLVMSGSSAYHAMLAGQFADGVQRPMWFLVADQSPAVIVATLHTCSILEPYLRLIVDGWIQKMGKRPRRRRDD